MVSKFNVPNIRGAFGCFLYEYETPDIDDYEGVDDVYDLPFGFLTCCVAEVLERAQSGWIDLGLLRNELLFAYQQGNDFWDWLNSNGERQYDVEEGVQSAALDCWDHFYPHAFSDVESILDVYHPDMLKLLMKRCVWDVLFPDETLPNYQEPNDGYLPHFEQFKRIGK